MIRDAAPNLPTYLSTFRSSNHI